MKKALVLAGLLISEIIGVVFVPYWLMKLFECFIGCPQECAELGVFMHWVGGLLVMGSLLAICGCIYLANVIVAINWAYAKKLTGGEK